ncbi:hypothetical protein AB9P05_14800 [Roseivirga sp. BDSF3-8]|uniref:hypothetical protein n=1 Tax=Roseivirga sp. BDSF3-8 TaxID=3241598 RepID=UPI003531E259
MAKRQQRITSKELPGAIEGLAGQLSTLVLRNGRALQVTPLSRQDSSLVVKDMLGKKRTIPLSDIEEIIVEHSA